MALDGRCLAAWPTPCASKVPTVFSWLFFEWFRTQKRGRDAGEYRPVGILEQVSQVTVTLPNIHGWMVHLYWNVPALLKVSDSVLPAFTVESEGDGGVGLALNVTVWA